MADTLSLNGEWDLTYAEGSHWVTPGYFTGAVVEGRHLFRAQVPGSVHEAMMAAGLMEDPNLGLNSLHARWVEEQFWIYRRTFRAPRAAFRQSAWLVFERLELDAVVYLNGKEIGGHANAHRPARFDVTGHLQAGDNLLVVLVSAGLHRCADKPSAGYCSGDMGALTKRHWRRSPQYQGGWDWNPRLINVGILGRASLEWSAGPRLGQVTVFAVPSPDLLKAVVTVRATVEGVSERPVRARLTARIRETGQSVAADVVLPKGESRHALTLALAKPRLWWPVGQGDQFRYTVDVDLTERRRRQRTTRRMGIRRVEMDQSPHPVEGRYCTLKINNRPVFCKGGNWVPPDMLYGRVGADRHRELVALAREANFNMLRVWGGGLFADPALCEACDEAGLMLWHDLLFACAQYPATDPAFKAEVEREVTHAVRERAHHPSLVVWCGNNEIEWGDWGWGYKDQAPAHPHYALFHMVLPRLMVAEDPSKVYWISSPFSPDFKAPNDPTVGDQHPWDVSLGKPGGVDWWNYRKAVDRFPNEGGILGMSSPATLRQFLPESQRALRSPAWDHHDNPFALMDGPPGEWGRAYKTIPLWTGRQPRDMHWEDYAFVSALLQAEGLQEYILNYRRRMFSSASAIFWMYNDSWPVTHGWTIVDYYLRKKLAWHPVRRAFQPVTVVVAEERDRVVVFGVNDSPAPWSGTLRYGLFTLAGARPLDQGRPVILPANASTALASFERARWEKLGLRRSGAFAVLERDAWTVAQHRLFSERFGNLAFKPPAIRMRRANGVLTLASPVFVWGVCLDVDGERPLEDNCFDLLPGIPYRMPWSARLGAPRIVRVGSRDAVKPARKPAKSSRVPKAATQGD